jgi:hypothetical protein
VLSSIFARDNSQWHAHTIRFLWTRDGLVAATSTWQHTTLTRHRHLSFRRDSNPQSQQARGLRSRPAIARPLESAPLLMGGWRFPACLNATFISRHVTHYVNRRFSSRWIAVADHRIGRSDRRVSSPFTSVFVGTLMVDTWGFCSSRWWCRYTYHCPRHSLHILLPSGKSFILSWKHTSRAVKFSSTLNTEYVKDVQCRIDLWKSWNRFECAVGGVGLNQLKCIPARFPSPFLYFTSMVLNSF